MKRNVYIYYRLTGIDSPDAETLKAMQAWLAEHGGVRGRLMRKCDDATTWMEVYEGIADQEAFAAALSDALRRHGIGKEGRHIEWFVENTD
ncbi:DUF4936 family protein [Paludibacterium paludis]|uniref:DUF4936 family protein n=1 Tax=Paludibacterium paludis TaxID=1225769 RepID=A0A918P0T8_9NEIS|nr:DUF4936 family protein [Paludibacterium paludis]GGY10580.1 hypothetical protein GCM10011289_11680 [Paludibacterium paludis]